MRYARGLRHTLCWCYTSRWPCNLDACSYCWVRTRFRRCVAVIWKSSISVWPDLPGMSAGWPGKQALESAWVAVADGCKPNLLRAMHGTCEQGAWKSCARRLRRDSKEHSCLPSSDESLAHTITMGAENGTSMRSNCKGYN